jgi:hypothetical protein
MSRRRQAGYGEAWVVCGARAYCGRQAPTTSKLRFATSKESKSKLQTSKLPFSSRYPRQVCLLVRPEGCLFGCSKGPPTNFGLGQHGWPLGESG